MLMTFLFEDIVKDKASNWSIKTMTFSFLANFFIESKILSTPKKLDNNSLLSTSNWSLLILKLTILFSRRILCILLNIAVLPIPALPVKTNNLSSKFSLFGVVT